MVRRKTHKRIRALVVAVLTAVLGGIVFSPVASRAESLLVPMDLTQTNHLKAYGLAFHALQQGEVVHWLLNYRGGSFVMPAGREIVLEARLKGVSFQEVSGSDLSLIYAEIERENMETVVLEKAPRIAVYTPPNKQPWDDAVTLALTYAEIPFDKVFDEEVLAGALSRYDWLHLHHEDFTGQYGKFYAGFRTADWYIREQILKNMIDHNILQYEDVNHILDIYYKEGLEGLPPEILPEGIKP